MSICQSWLCGRTNMAEYRWKYRRTNRRALQPQPVVMHWQTRNLWQMVTKGGTASKISRGCPKAFVISFWRRNRPWRRMRRRRAGSDSTIAVRSLIQPWRLVLVTLSESTEAVTSWVTNRWAPTGVRQASTAVWRATTVVHLWAERSHNFLSPNLSRPSGALMNKEARVMWTGCNQTQQYGPELSTNQSSEVGKVYGVMFVLFSLKSAFAKSQVSTSECPDNSLIFNKVC